MATGIAIIGAGPAGITAAIYALRAGIQVTIFEKNIYGGQTSIIDNIENYPGFSKISGADFSDALYRQATELGAKFIFDEVIAVELNNELKTITTKNKGEFQFYGVIIANGLKRRKLGCKGEEKFVGRGVSYCATCDGAFFRDKSVIVVGGGNTALEDALYLSNICKKVTMVVRKSYFRGENFLVDTVKKTNNIDILFESKIIEIRGQKCVEKVVMEGNGGEHVEREINGVFIAIGYEPDNEMYKDEIAINEDGYLIAEEDCETTIAGVYVAGDCRTKNLRQIATAIADGAVSGNSIASYVRMAIHRENVR